jgi:hypothetical protein
MGRYNLSIIIEQYMTNEFIPTKEKQTIYGNVIYLNDDGDMVMEHISGNVIVTKASGEIATTRPNGIVTTVNPDGTSETRDADGNLIHIAEAGQKYSVTQGGDVDF